MKQLMDNDMYFNRPAEELIFLTRQDHASLHNKGRKDSLETLQKRSNSMKGKGKGRHISEETKRKQSDSIRRYYAEHPGILKGHTPWNKGKHGVQTSWMKGKTLSDDMRRKISNTLKGNDPWNKGIAQEEKTKLKIRDSLRKIYPVRQLDVHGNIIAEYSSVFEAEEKTGIKAKYIKRVINGERRHHKGFIFEKMI